MLLVAHTFFYISLEFYHNLLKTYRCLGSVTSLKRIVHWLTFMLGRRKSESELTLMGLSKGKPMARRSGYLRSRIPQYDAASLQFPTISCTTCKK